MIALAREAFWKWLAIFAYRRWARCVGPERKKPWGVPGNRDPDNPCDMYSPRRAIPGDWGDCQGDGHALCQQCCRLDRKRRDDYVPESDEDGD